MGSFQDLVFYQKARQVAKDVNALVKRWPKSMQAQEISRQLFRSATSVGANIAEGHGRHQGTEYIHYLIIAQGSANETEHWLCTAQDCGLDINETISKISKLNNEVIKMITSTIVTIRAKQRNTKIQEDSPAYNIDTDLAANE